VAIEGDKARLEGRGKGVDRGQAMDVGRIGTWDEEALASFEKKGDGSMQEGFLLFLLRRSC
jgi:hypothetical protein